MSDTPRTDEFMRPGLRDMSLRPTPGDWERFARQLERELNAMKLKLVPDAPEGYRYELMRIATADEEKQLDTQ